MSKRRIHHPSPSYRCDGHWKSMITWSKLHLYTSCPILGCLSWCPTSIAVVATIPTFNIKIFPWGSIWTPSCFAEPDLRRCISKWYVSTTVPVTTILISNFQLCMINNLDQSFSHDSVVLMCSCEVFDQTLLHVVECKYIGGGTPQPYDETSEFKHL